MFIFSSVIVYSHGVSGTVWTHNNHALQLSCLLSHFPCCFVYVVFLWFFQSLTIIMHLIAPVIELSSLCFFLSHFLGTWVCLCVLLRMCVCVCLDICGCVSVSAENLEKSLRQMEMQLLQLERDLETFSSPDDPNDMFLTKMAISFKHAHAFTHQFGALFNEFTLTQTKEGGIDSSPILGPIHRFLYQYPSQLCLCRVIHT